MNFKKPKFWDYKNPSLLSYLLLPLTIFIEINNLFLKLNKNKNKNKIKSVCVGNIYVGGTGKTPTTIKIYKILKKLGFFPYVGKKIYKNQADEVTILENHVDLITGGSRSEIFSKVKKKRKSVIIFDDGLQDRNMSYDLKIVCFDSFNTIGNGFLIPAGPLRERISSLSNYDCVILKGENRNTKKFINEMKNINKKIRIFNTYFKIKNFDILNKLDKHVIFSGIGSPNNFKEILLKNRIKIIKEFIFPDHYTYSANDIKNIKRFAIENNAKIITTEKDFVKLSKNNQKNIYYLKVETIFKNEKKFINYLKLKMYEKY